jgi:ElaB/YqjD/DUF883 family membrane-anchored ribosome-binding protein
MEEKLDSHKEQLEKIEERIFGNGQPGMFTLLSDRVGVLEKWKWKVVGIGTGAGAVIGMLLKNM